MSNVNTRIHPGNFQCFIDEYKEQLIKARREFPDQYAWPESELEQVFNRMISAIERGSFDKDSHAFKRTCKALGIKHTYTAIKEFIS